VVGLNPDQFFRGYAFVTYKTHETELFHLPKKERTGFCEEMIGTAKVLDSVFHPEKMNYSLLGNLGAAKGTGGHLHWHLIPRYKGDPFWGQPPFYRHEKLRLSRQEYSRLILEVRNRLVKLSSS